MKHLDLLFPSFDHRRGISRTVVFASLGELFQPFGQRFLEICALTGAS